MTTIKDLGYIKFARNDGGRAAYFKGKHARDCAVRAIAIALKRDYKQVYDELYQLNREYQSNRPKWRRRNPSPRTGVPTKVIHRYLVDRHGCKWVSLVKIGSPDRTHMRENELPSHGRYVLRLTRHVTAYVNGVLYDTHDCTRKGTRMVYGLWIMPAK